MNIISVTSPKYSKADKSAIDCIVTFDNGKTFPYTAAAYDKEVHGVRLWTDLNAGTYGTIATFGT